MIINQKRCI